MFSLSALAGIPKRHRVPRAHLTLIALLVTGLVATTFPGETVSAGKQKTTPVESAGASPPTVSLSPTSGPTGSELTVRGTGFPKNQAGQLFWSNNTSSIAAVNTNGSGSFRASVKVPNVSPDVYTVSAVIGQVKASASFTVSTSPSTTPTPTPSPTATPTPLPSPTATPTSSPTATPPPTVTGEYFVSMTGSDGNDGKTPSTAWRTFANVRANKVPTGSTVLAQAGGVWQETVRLYANNLKFGVYGTGPRPKIVAPDGQHAFDGNWKPGIQIQGWEFTSATRRGAQTGIVHVAAHDYVVRDIVVHGADGWMFISRGVRGLVENSEFYDNDGAGETSAVSVGGYEGSGYPNSSDVTIFRNNYIHHTGYRAFNNWGSNVLVEGNRVESWSKAGVYGSATQAPAGIYVSSRYLGDVIVRNNRLTGTGVENRAIWVDAGPEHRTIVEGNSAVNALGCFWAEKTDNVILRGNTCEGMQKDGALWGSGSSDPVQDPSVNGQIIQNTFIGSVPTDGWIIILPGSSAEVVGNSYIP